MKAIPGSVLAWLLAKKPVFPVDLYLFTFTSGDTLALSTFHLPINYNGNTYYGNSGYPIISRDEWEIKNTIEVPSLQLTLLSNGTDYGSVNIKRAIINGLFDGSTLLMSRIFLNPQSGSPIGAFDIYKGICGPIQVGPTGAKITYRGANIRMEQNYPKNIYTAGCIWSLFGPGCLVNRDDFTFSGTVAQGSTSTQINWNLTLSSQDHYSQLGLGYITFTSGILDGDKRTLQLGTPSYGQVMYPLDGTPAEGDTFTVTYGCRKTLTYCTEVFANQQRWRGFPFIPPAETTL